MLKNKISTQVTEVRELKDSQDFQITFGDGHQVTVSSAKLNNRRTNVLAYQRNGVVPVSLWDDQIKSQPPTADYTALQSDGLGALLRKVREYGFCFVDDMPATPEATESILKTIGPIRNTHYGAFYDFTADLSSKDTAYTNESLEPHTDNTYFTEPAGLQALHMLSHTDGSGGESSLVDGFGAARKLFDQDKDAYLTLSLVGVHAHASGNEGISIQPAEPVPVLSHDLFTRQLTQVRWNNADRGGIMCKYEDMDRWYDAAS